MSRVMTRPAPAAPAARPRRPKSGLILKLAGTLCLVAALAVAGYLGWALWGTGLSTARAQRSLRAQIAPELAHPELARKGRPVPHVHLRDGQALAVLVIPRIHLDMVVVEGADSADLMKGPGHYVGTAFPWQPHGRVAIAGHRTTYLHPFWSIDKLRRGDVIELRTRYGTFDYHVTGRRDVLPTASWVLTQTRAPTLVLTTCTPRFSATHRLVVFAAR